MVSKLPARSQNCLDNFNSIQTDLILSGLFWISLDRFNSVLSCSMTFHYALLHVNGDIFAKYCFARGFHVLCWFFLLAINRTLFLWSWCHYLKYSTCHVYLQLWPMLYLCICVFASRTPGNIVFEVPVSLPFRKYMVFMVQNLAQLRKFEMSRLWRTHTHTVSAVFCWGRIRNWCVKLFSFKTVEAMSSGQLLLPKN